MKPRCSNQRSRALTVTEVLVVIVVLAVLVAMILPQLAAAKRNSRGPWCVNNLKQIGLACRIWAGDHNDKYPMDVSVANGGTMELAADGKSAWLNYLVMSNELSTPKVLICPQDTRRLPPAQSFSTELVGKVSYFVGMDAKPNNPQRVLSGDDNLVVNGVQVHSGILTVSTNASVKWTEERHHGFGNALLASGSVFSVGVIQSPPPPFQNLQQAFAQSGLATNRLAIP